MTRRKNGLRACPFCGNPGVHMTVYPRDGVQRFRNRYAVLCDYADGGCGAESGHYTTAEEAIAAWNQRKRRREE